MTNQPTNQLMEIALRIRDLRDIFDFTKAQMAEKTDVSVDQYEEYESGRVDFQFTFLHKCALAYGIEVTDLLEGQSAKLSGYTVTRKGK